MFNQFTFEYPYVLLLIIIFIICAKYCKAKASAYYMPHLNIYNQTRTINNQLITIIQWLLIIFSLIALASPVKHLQTIHQKSDGIDIVLALDTSGSMRHIGFDKDDLEKNRWQVVQEIVKDFIPKRVNDNIALVVFGTAVMTASPLSYDKQAQQEILSHLDIGVAGDKTALLDSIVASVNILKKSKAKSKIIILLTDGEDTASKIPYQVAIKLALKYNIKIYTIAIGRVNQNLLHKIATSTKGSFFNANSKDDLKQIYNQIDKLEKSSLDKNKIVIKEYYFFYPLFLAIMFLVLFIYLKNKKGEL